MSFCLALSYFFRISSFVRICGLPVFLLLPSVALLSPQFLCAMLLVLSVGWVPLLGFPFRSFLSYAWFTCIFLVVGVFLFRLSPLAHSSLLPVVVPLWGSCFFSHGLPCSWDSFLFFWRSSDSVESPGPSTTGSSLWAESVAS